MIVFRHSFVLLSLVNRFYQSVWSTLQQKKVTFVYNRRQGEKRRESEERILLSPWLCTCQTRVSHYIFYFAALRTNERFAFPLANMSNENLQQTDSSSYASVNESSLSTSSSSYHTARESSNPGYETPTMQFEHAQASPSSSVSDLTLAEALDEGKMFLHRWWLLAVIATTLHIKELSLSVLINDNGTKETFRVWLNQLIFHIQSPSTLHTDLIDH